MKNLERVILLAAIGFFAVVNATVAQNVASPTEPIAGDSKKAVAKGEKEDLEKTYGKVAPQLCETVVPTIAPPYEYKRPAFDFVPVRVRTKEREI